MEYEKVRDFVASSVARFTSFRNFLDKTKYDDEPLTGEVFKLSARDLLYLYFTICKEQQIYVSLQEAAAYTFNSIAGITNLLLEKRMEL